MTLSARQLEALEQKLDLAVRALFDHRRHGARIEDVAARVVHYDRAVAALRAALLAEVEEALAPEDRPELEAMLRRWSATAGEPALWRPFGIANAQDVVVNVSLGPPHYARWQKRLVESCRYFGCAALTWTEAYPAGARPHHESLYGFKYHALARAFDRGFERALWLDAPVYLRKPPTDIFRQIDRDGVLLVATPDALADWIDDRTLAAFDLSRDEVRARGWRLLCGSFVGVRRGSPFLSEVLRYEREGYFYDAIQDAAQVHPGHRGHRHDESVISILAYAGGYAVTPQDVGPFQNASAAAISERTP